MLKLKLWYFGHLMQRADSLGKTLMLGKIQGGKRRDDRAWDGWMASPTQRTWVWANCGRWWRTGKPGVLWSMDTTEQLINNLQKTLYCNKEVFCSLEGDKNFGTSRAGWGESEVQGRPHWEGDIGVKSCRGLGGEGSSPAKGMARREALRWEHPEQQGGLLWGGFFSSLKQILLEVKTLELYMTDMLADKANTWNKWVSQVVLVVKNLPANTRDIRDTGLIPGLGRSPGGGHDNPLQYSCLENPMDRGALWATVHKVANSRTWLKQLSTVHIFAKWITILVYQESKITGLHPKGFWANGSGWRAPEYAFLESSWVCWCCFFGHHS